MYTYLVVLLDWDVDAAGNVWFVLEFKQFQQSKQAVRARCLHVSTATKSTFSARGGAQRVKRQFTGKWDNGEEIRWFCPGRLCAMK